MGPNQTDKYIKTTPDIEEYVGQTYGAEVRKAIIELERKVSLFIKPEDLSLEEQLSLMHTVSSKLNF